MFDGAKLQLFPDIPAVSAELLVRRSGEGEKRRAASLRRGFRCRPPWGHFVCLACAFGSRLVSQKAAM